MLLEFSVTNFRSIREKQTFSMVASSSQSKLDNTFEVTLKNGETFRLVKSVGIYGANSFGKSNLIFAIAVFKHMIENSIGNKINESISEYNPFLFHKTTQYAPTIFEILFIGEDLQKYHYIITYNESEILSEILSYFPKRQKQTIFKRESNQELVHIGKMGKNFGNKKYELYKNQLLLSKFGSDIPDGFLANIFLYLIKNINIFTSDDETKTVLIKELGVSFKNPSFWFSKKLSKLLQIADTKIEGFTLLKENGEEKIYTQHNIYDQNKNKTGYFNLPFAEESEGTQSLFVLGIVILVSLRLGKILFIDEFDTKLNPYLSRFLVQLFNHPIANANKAQLIFVSHEPHILDKNSMRADQIWFANKNDFGETEFYSAQDFENIREDIPFDKWYLGGKFGAVPQINELDILKIFETE